jgi:hypothetical protein
MHVKMGWPRISLFHGCKWIFPYAREMTETSTIITGYDCINWTTTTCKIPYDLASTSTACTRYDGERWATTLCVGNKRC